MLLYWQSQRKYDLASFTCLIDMEDIFAVFASNVRAYLIKINVHRSPVLSHSSSPPPSVHRVNVKRVGSLR